MLMESDKVHRSYERRCKGLVLCSREESSAANGPERGRGYEHG